MVISLFYSPYRLRLRLASRTSWAVIWRSSKERGYSLILELTVSHKATTFNWVCFLMQRQYVTTSVENLSVRRLNKNVQSLPPKKNTWAPRILCHTNVWDHNNTNYCLVGDNLIVKFTLMPPHPASYDVRYEIRYLCHVLAPSFSYEEMQVAALTNHI